MTSLETEPLSAVSEVAVAASENQELANAKAAHDELQVMLGDTPLERTYHPVWARDYTGPIGNKTLLREQLIVTFNTTDDAAGPNCELKVEQHAVSEGAWQHLQTAATINWFAKHGLQRVSDYTTSGASRLLRGEPFAV